jgi:hypothetical protein
VAERFIRTLKEQVIYGRVFRNLQELREAVRRFVDTYNHEWRLERLSYMSPVEFRNSYLTKEAAWCQTWIQSKENQFGIMERRMPLRKRIISEIESAGYRVTGFREALERKESGQLFVTAEKLNTGECHTVTVFTPGAEGETEALQKLAAELGLTGIDQQ